MGSQFVEDVRNEEHFDAHDKLDKTITDTSLDKNVEDYITKFLDISEDAKDNDAKDKKMPLIEGLKTFPKAAMWSVILSSALIMEGYDTNLLNSMYAMPAFKEKYGELVSGQGPDDPNAEYEVLAKIQTSLSMGIYVGEILGLFAAGIIADRFGFRWTLIGALMMTTAFIFVVFFSVDEYMLIAGEILLGIPWGAFQTLTVSYASEVCPLVLRIYLTTYVNLCWVFGQLISSGILKGLAENDTEDAFRIPWGIQWIWPVPIMIGIYLAPESPWWLVRQGKLPQAKKALMRLITENKFVPNRVVVAEAMMSKMQVTLEEEAVNSQSGISYWDCFKGRDFRRTRIACGTWLIQNITGSALMGYSTYFYLQAGLSVSMSFTFSIIQYVLGLIGTIGSWFASQKLGRFTIYFSGLSINTCILMIVGGLGCSSLPNAPWGIGSLLLIFTFIYDLSVGPLCYCIVAEIPSAKLRTKTIILARCTYNIAGIVIHIITPYMLNPTAWNWQAKTGFFWAGFALVSAIWCWFELPETKGKTYAELDILFREKTPSRKFRKAQVDVFDVNEMIEKIGKDGVKRFVEKNTEAQEIQD